MKAIFTLVSLVLSCVLSAVRRKSAAGSASNLKLYTYDDIILLGPCSDHTPSKYVSESWTGTAVDILDLDNVAYSEKIWVAKRLVPAMILKRWAIESGRRALTYIKTPDPRSVKALNVAERFLRGEATQQEMSDAYAAADAAADVAADVAARAAYAAADVDAYAAARAAYAAARAADAAADVDAYAAARAAYAAADAAAARAAYAAARAADVAAARKEEQQRCIASLRALLVQYGDL